MDALLNGEIIRLLYDEKKRNGDRSFEVIAMAINKNNRLNNQPLYPVIFEEVVNNGGQRYIVAVEYLDWRHEMSCARSLPIEENDTQAGVLGRILGSYLNGGEMTILVAGLDFSTSFLEEPWNDLVEERERNERTVTFWFNDSDEHQLDKFDFADSIKLEMKMIESYFTRHRKQFAKEFPPLVPIMQSLIRKYRNLE